MVGPRQAVRPSWMVYLRGRGSSLQRVQQREGDVSAADDDCDVTPHRMHAAVQKGRNAPPPAPLDDLPVLLPGEDDRGGDLLLCDQHGLVDELLDHAKRPAVL